MSYFAKVENGVVTRVIAAKQDVIDSGLLGDPSLWVQTSYNTRGGVHYAPDSDTPDGGIALRANYAGLGFIYDSAHDVFYPQQPFPSWSISAPTWMWEAPVPYPTDKKLYYWDEPTLSWKLIT
jgi:hypothetical protein